MGVLSQGDEIALEVKVAWLLRGLVSCGQVAPEWNIMQCFIGPIKVHDTLFGCLNQVAFSLIQSW